MGKECKLNSNCGNTLELNIFEKWTELKDYGGFDLGVGNPPY